MTRINNLIEKLNAFKDKYGNIPVMFSEIDPYIEEEVNIKLELLTSDEDLYVGLYI